MYLDRPKSPSFTQSGLATNTFRTAMSLWQNINRAEQGVLNGFKPTLIDLNLPVDYCSAATIAAENNTKGMFAFSPHRQKLISFVCLFFTADWIHEWLLCCLKTVDTILQKQLRETCFSFLLQLSVMTRPSTNSSSVHKNVPSGRPKSLCISQLTRVLNGVSVVTFPHWPTRNGSTVIDLKLLISIAPFWYVYSMP